MKEYKVHVYQESLLGSMLLGQSKVDPERMTRSLNELADAGWQVKGMEREKRRMLLFWSREAFLFILERDKRPSPPGAN